MHSPSYTAEALNPDLINSKSTMHSPRFTVSTSRAMGPLRLRFRGLFASPSDVRLKEALSGRLFLSWLLMIAMVVRKMAMGLNMYEDEKV